MFSLNMVDYPKSFLLLSTWNYLAHLPDTQGVFPGFWHFNISATSNVDGVLHVMDHEHVELTLVLALDVPLCLG